MIVVDVETTGLDPTRHAIVSIGALEFEDPKNQFYKECRIDENTVVDEYALGVNGYSKADITDPAKPTLAEIIKEFADWSLRITDKTLAGHNTYFDQSMLQVGFKKAKAAWPFGFRLLDTHSLCYAHMAGRGLKIPLYKEVSDIKSSEINKYVGLPREPEPHVAITGAKMEAEALSRLIHGRNLLAEFKQYPIPEYLKTEAGGDETAPPTLF